MKAITDDTTFLSRQTPVDKTKFIHDIEQHRFLPNVTIVFGLSGDPAQKYSLNSIADAGSNSCTSSRLIEEHNSLLFETEQSKFKLSYNHQTSKFEFSSIKNVEFGKKVDSEFCIKNAVPIYTDLEWKEIQWGSDSVIIRGQEYKLTVVGFMNK